MQNGERRYSLLTLMAGLGDERCPRSASRSAVRRAPTRVGDRCTRSAGLRSAMDANARSGPESLDQSCYFSDRHRTLVGTNECHSDNASRANAIGFRQRRNRGKLPQRIGNTHIDVFFVECLSCRHDERYFSDPTRSSSALVALFVEDKNTE
jgi:hypothetical protein